MEGLNHSKRMGKFTSSQIYRLCSSLKNGNPNASFFTYIEEVIVEQYLGRRAKTNINTKATKHGKLMEAVLFHKLGINYSMNVVDTVLHPEYGDFWSGTPDLKAIDKTAEIKCFEPLAFGKLSITLDSKNIETIKINEPKVYWQTVSNSILCGFDKAEIIAFMPYKHELLEIFEMIRDTDFLEKNNLNPFDYIYFREDSIEDYAYLPDDSNAKSINQFEFIIPKEDKEFLTSRVLEASKLLKH